MSSPLFSGIIPPIVTPLLPNGELDTAAVDRLVQHLVEGGVSGLFLLGTTGEGPSLSQAIKKEMIQRMCQAASVPVLVNVTDCCLAESLRLAKHAKACGAAAVVSAAPFYFSITQADVITWFRQLADASELPLLLYNIPSCVGINLARETVVELSQHDNIVGIKDSSGDIEDFCALCRDLLPSDDDGFSILMGPEELIPQAVAAGAHGAICGGANLLPELYVQLYHAARSNNSKEIDRLRNIVDDVMQHVYQQSDLKSMIGGLKYAMQQCGLIPSAHVAPPLQLASPNQREIIDANLSRILQSCGSSLVSCDKS